MPKCCSTETKLIKSHRCKALHRTMINARREILMKTCPSEKLIPHFAKAKQRISVMTALNHFAALAPQSHDKLQITPPSRMVQPLCVHEVKIMMAQSIFRKKSLICVLIQIHFGYFWC